MMIPEFHPEKVAMLEPRERFPTRVTSVEKLSGSLQEVVQPFCSGAYHIVRIPTGYYPFRRRWRRIQLPFGWRQTPERILVFEPDVITIIENDPAGQVTITSVPRTALLKIHVFVCLLYSYIELVWANGDHIETREFEYNAVGEALILRGIDQFRTAYPPRLRRMSVDNREEILARLPLKFRNYLRDSLLRDEQLHAAVFQPTIRQGISLLHPPLSPNRAVGITERHIILVDDQQRRFSAELGYSTYRCFYPLAQIQHMAVEATSDVSWLKLQHGCGSVTQTTDIALLPTNAEPLWAILQDHVLRVSGREE